MGSKHIDSINSRRSGRLLERWVTICTGKPLSEYNSAREAPTFQAQRSYFESIPEVEESELAPVSTDISLGRDIVNYEITRTMAAEDRFKAIESDVTTLKTDMSSVNEKLDRLLDSFARLNTNNTPRNSDLASPLQDRNTSAPEEHGATGHSNSDAPNPSRNTNGSRCPPHVHHLVGRQMTADDFIERELQRDRFEYPNNGRGLYSNDMSASRIIAKPYMYLYREGIQTMKHRLDARTTLSLNEYLDAVLALLADRRAYTATDYNDIMDHVRKVVRDALERPWPAVRRWSQYVWDMVESGQITWGDRDIIQEERVRLCLTSTLTVSSAGASYDNRKAATSNQVICRPYNTRMGCQYRESHGDASIWYLHSCSYCDSVGKTCYHSVRECERRVTHSRNDYPAQQNRNRQFQQNSYQPQQFSNQNNGSQQYPQAYPKNGF